MACPEAELSLTLLGDKAMSLLNRATFGKSGPTNVIAFPVDWGEGVADEERGEGGQGLPPAEKPAPPAPALSSAPLPPTRERGKDADASGAPGLVIPGPPLVLGEVAISVETTVRQAAESGWPWEELLDFYLIHGILHLMGYDHETPADEARMEAKTWELMQVLEEGA